jgi:rubrerythrin
MHPTAEDIYREVRKEMPAISLDTVNRTLLTLAEIGAAFIVEGTGQPRRFDGGLEDHQHFLCIKCGKVIDFHHPPFYTMGLKGTKTEKNLLTAFAGESQARNRYTYFAGQAKKEGFEQIAAIFEETANQEKEHAKRLFKFLEGGEVEICAAFPAGVIGTTTQNLEEAAAGEDYETKTMYPDFAKIADGEGFAEVAAVFRKIAVAEARHRDRYLA